MQSLKQLASQTAVYGLSSIIGRFLNYLLTPLYTYQFVAKDYGVVTEMYAYVAFLVVLLTFGMETAFFRFVGKSDEPSKVYNTALFPVASISAVFMIVCIYFSDGLASFIQYPDHSEFITWFAIIVSLDAISAIPLARLRHENKAFRFAFINLSSIGLNIGLNLFFIAYCKVWHDNGETSWLIETFYNPAVGVGYIFIANLAASLFKAALLSPYLMKLSPKLDKVLLKSMLFYAMPLLVAGLAGIANENLDRLLLKYLLLESEGLEKTMTQVGIYGACYKVSILITLFVQAYRYAAEPFFFSKASDLDAKQIYADMMKYFVIVCLFIFLALMLNIDLVMLFVGDEYRVGAPIVPILLMANIFLGVYYNLSVWYKLTDKTMFGAYISLVGAGITIAINLMLIPILGYIGSAWATLICYASMAALSFAFGRKHYKISYPLLKIGGYFLLVMGIYALTSSISMEHGIKIFVNNGILLALALFIYSLERPKKIII